MCHNRTNNNKINRLYERCLRLIYNDKKSSFEDLLQKDGSLSIHHRNLRILAVELFKVFKGLSPVIFAEAFPVRQQSQYNLRNYSYFAMLRAKTVNHGLESLSFIGAKLWDGILYHMKEIDSINEFKQVIKTWKPHLCSCRLCKVYLQNIGYLYSAKNNNNDSSNNNNNNNNNNNTYMYTKIHTCLGKSEYHNCFSRLPYVVHSLFLV